MFLFHVLIKKRKRVQIVQLMLTGNLQKKTKLNRKGFVLKYSSRYNAVVIYTVGYQILA